MFNLTRLAGMDFPLRVSLDIPSTVLFVAEDFCRFVGATDADRLVEEHCQDPSPVFDLHDGDQIVHVVLLDMADAMRILLSLERGIGRRLESILLDALLQTLRQQREQADAAALAAQQSQDQSHYFSSVMRSMAIAWSERYGSPDLPWMVQKEIQAMQARGEIVIKRSEEPVSN